VNQVRIGAGQGFYGDTVEAALDVAEHGDVGYICCDSLAELTIAILQKDRIALGWADDDWDRLGAGVVLGHLMEYSAQATGGTSAATGGTCPTPTGSDTRCAK
jgi:hypothetical protein